MGDALEQRWDDEVGAAWTAYRRRLADRLADLEQEESLAVVVGATDEDDQEGAAPYCQAMAWGGRGLTVEAVSDTFLAAEHRVGAGGAERLRALGFHPPSGEESPNHHLTVDQREADRAAWMVVGAMREVFGVLHPAFLVDDLAAAPGPDPAEEVAEASTWAVRDEHWPTDDHGPWFPEGGEDVRRAVHRVVRELTGDEPEWDDDDDLPLLTEEARVWVVVANALPRILLTCTLLTDVVDESRALVEVNLLNRRHFGLTFLLDDRRVVVRRELGVSAFQPTEVRAELARLLEHVDRWVVELRERVGGRGASDEAAATPLASRGPGEPAGVDDAQQRRFAAAYDVMRELEREERGSADPVTLARVFHHDRALVMLAVAATRAREAQDRRRAERQLEAERPALAKRFRASARYQRELRSRLRRALRITVQAGPRSEVPEQPGLFAEEDVRG